MLENARFSLLWQWVSWHILHFPTFLSIMSVFYGQIIKWYTILESAWSLLSVFMKKSYWAAEKCHKNWDNMDRVEFLKFLLHILLYWTLSAERNIIPTESLECGLRYDTFSFASIYFGYGKVVKSLNFKLLKILLAKIFWSTNFFFLLGDLLGRHVCWQNFSSAQWLSAEKMTFLTNGALLGKISEIFDWSQIGPGWTQDQKLHIRAHVSWMDLTSHSLAQFKILQPSCFWLILSKHLS